MLPMVVARSYFGGVAMCCVIPVLWITPCLHIVTLWRVMYAAFHEKVAAHLIYNHI